MHILLCTLAQAKYGERHPPFVPVGLKQASLQARSEHRFLLVYLHSADHQVSMRANVLFMNVSKIKY